MPSRPLPGGPTIRGSRTPARAGAGDSPEPSRMHDLPTPGAPPAAATATARPATPSGGGPAPGLAQASLAEVFEQSPSFMAILRGPEHVFELANDRYRQLVGHRDLIG